MTASFMTRRELATALKLSPKTLARMEREGLGPRPLRLSPRVVRYPESSVAEFIAVAAPAEIAISR